MARKLQDIYDSLVAEKQAKPELDGIDTTSSISVWQNLFWVITAIMYLFETMWDNFRSEIDMKVAEAFPGTLDWYKNEALKFQYRDTPVLIDNKYNYAAIDATKQIIARCSVYEGFNSVILKVAKETNGVPEKLSTGELSAFGSYMQTYRKFAGIPLLIYTQNSDKLKISYDIYYKANFDLDTVKASVDAAINTYLENLSFDATLLISRLTDAIQNADGVLDPVVTSVYARPDASSFVNVVRIYTPISGFFGIDASYPLSDTLNYIAYNE